MSTTPAIRQTSARAPCANDSPEAVTRPPSTSHARELVWLLREHGVAIHELWTQRPGYVEYRDRWQVVAEPFRDTGA